VENSVSKSSASQMLGRDRATIRIALQDVTPDAPPAGSSPRWKLETVVEALRRHDDRIGRARAVNAIGGDHPGNGSNGAGDDFRSARPG